ncbi:hypothetical protein FHS20_003845 [Phyllobacterium endophyticum]|nr:hypothetical protein [Phyllobacterium endophyticum]
MTRFSPTGIKSQPVEQSSYEVSMLHDCLPPAASSRASLQGNTAQPQLALDPMPERVERYLPWSRPSMGEAGLFEINRGGLSLYNNASD